MPHFSGQRRVQKEADTLRKFSGNSHSHLVSLHASYEQFGKFYLLFPWAEAHLRDYWKAHRTPTTDDASILWLAEQCRGIADGLTKIHRHITTFHQRRTVTAFMDSESHPMSEVDTEKQDGSHFRQQLFGRHGGIKPENVLLFRDSSYKHDRGVLKISDFGLTEFTNRRSQCYKKNNQVAHSLTYRPPECDLEGAVVGPSYDIWTLGCLYLELITWQLGGWSMLQSFQNKRWLQDPMRHNMPTDTFFEIVRCEETNTYGAMVKPAVKQVNGSNLSRVKPDPYMNPRLILLVHFGFACSLGLHRVFP